MMLLAGPGAAEPVVGPESAGRLARLGITRASVLSDGTAVGVVLEGWAFDPAEIDEAIRAIFPDGDASVRIFREVEHVTLAVPRGPTR